MAHYVSRLTLGIKKKRSANSDVSSMDVNSAIKADLYIEEHSKNHAKQHAADPERAFNNYLYLCSAAVINVSDATQMENLLRFVPPSSCLLNRVT